MAIKAKIRSLLSDDIVLKVKTVISRPKKRAMLEKHKKVQPYQRGRYPQGINLIGDISAETGLGQSIRILASMLQNGEIPFCVKQVNLHGQLEHNDHTWKQKIVDKVQYSVNVITIIPETWPEDYCALENEILDGRYNIAFWLWELEEFPDRWVSCIETVDEIWTPSEFVSRSIRQKTDKPVITVPYIVEMKNDIKYDRKYFGFPKEKFLFLTMYDFISISERKNPEAVIKAYMQAFPEENEGVGIVIKVNHAEKKKMEELAGKLAGYKNVYFITRNLTRQEVDSLMAVTDVLVSLHRSEGFGLPVAEAMALGKPVITTNWSATTEFTDTDCACPVDYQLISLKKTIGPYEKGNYWADADVAHAAAYMKRLWEDKEYAEKIGRNAKTYISAHLTYEHAANIVKGRLKDIE